MHPVRCHPKNVPGAKLDGKCGQRGRGGNRPTSLFSENCASTRLSRRLSPCPGDKRIEPVLPALDPLRIVALGRPNRFVAEQLGYFLQWDSLFKQIHGERVPQPVAPHVPITFNFRCLKCWDDEPLPPIAGDALFRPIARPEEVDVVLVLDRKQFLSNIRRDWHGDICACLSALGDYPVNAPGFIMD